MTKITSTGTTERHYKAERATVVISVATRHESRSEAIAQTTDAHNEAMRLVRLLESEGRATWVKGDPISTYQRQVKHEGSETWRNVYVSSSRVMVKLQDLAYVSGFVTDLQEKGYSTSVSWSLTEVTRKARTSEVRRRAVQKAREVADEYASALGHEIVSVKSISDVAASSGMYASKMRGSAGSAPAEITIPEITISAAVIGVYKSGEPVGGFGLDN